MNAAGLTGLTGRPRGPVRGIYPQQVLSSCNLSAQVLAGGQAHQLGVIADKEASCHAVMQSGLLAAQRALVQVPRRDARSAQQLLARAKLLRLGCVRGKEQAPGALPLHVAGAQVRLLEKPLPAGAAVLRQLPGCAGWVPVRQPDVPLPCVKGAAVL